MAFNLSSSARLAGIAFLCTFLNIQPGTAQRSKGEITGDELVTSEISGAENHRYQLRLGPGETALLRLTQQGVDLKAATFGLKGEKLNEFDSPNGSYGPEFIRITSTDPGLYSIEISQLNADQPPGRYTLQVQKIKPKAATAGEEADDLFLPWDSGDTPGVAVAVIKGGRIVYKKGFGMANLEYDIPVSPATIFHIASVSKQFTVFSILLLEKAGKLSLKDDIRKYLPELPDFGKTITLEHLASHTSGLRDQWNLLAMAGWRLDDVITKEHIFKMMCRQKGLNFDPGEEFLYCNTGFTLLAEVVSRVSGMSFADFTRENIFVPLGMAGSLFYDDHEKIVRNRAYSYYEDSTGYKKSVLNYANVGATSLFTTVEDLSRWVLNFNSPKVGDAALITKMNTPAVLNNGTSFGGALGQFIGEYKGLREIQHGGADAGYRSFLARFPDQDAAVVVLSNDAGFNAGEMAHKVADIFLRDRLKTDAGSPVEPVHPNVTAVVPDQNVLDSYVGDYELQPGFIINISAGNGTLSARATGQPARELQPISDTEFAVSGVEAVISFLPQTNGKPALLQLAQGGQVRDAPRVAHFEKTTVNLSEFTGTYYSEELATEYRFLVEDGKLIARHSRHGDIEMQPVKEDVFGTGTWFFQQIAFVRNENHRLTGCKVSSGRVRDLEFQKVE